MSRCNDRDRPQYVGVTQRQRARPTTGTLSTRLVEDVIERVRRYAERHDVTMAKFVRVAIGRLFQDIEDGKEFDFDVYGSMRE